MIQPRQLHIFKLNKPISTPLRPQQATTRSFSSTSCLRQRHQHNKSGIRTSKTQHRGQDPISRQGLAFSAKNSKPDDQRAFRPRALDHRNDVPNSSTLDRDLRALRWKHDRPPKEGLRGMGGHERFLFWKPSICYRNGHVQTAQALEKEKPSRAAAEKFFEQPCELLYSAAANSHHAENDHIPEIVVVGASNAGKSSFLNALLGGVEIAKVSHRPGKTTTMNAYGVGPRPKIAPELIRKGDAPPKHSLVLMDTPGYGHRSKASWGETIVQYLMSRKKLRGAVLLIPVDKDNYGMDKWMLKTLARTMTPTLVVMTKVDKCGEAWQTECLRHTEWLEYELERQDRLAPGKWREGSERTLSVYATAAGLNTTRRLGNGAGIGGVRLAILELAGFDIKGRVEQQPETKAYTGEIVSFDDIVWKA